MQLHTRKWLCALCLGWLLSVLTGCSSLPEPVPVNLSEPGWTVREGQAIWRSPARHLELTGDYLVATHSDGRSFVQFDKAPFPLLVAQTSQCGWHIRFVAQNKTRQGKGVPPAKWLWLQLPACFGGDRPAPPCRFTPEQDGRWRLEHPGTGESLEGYFAGHP